MTVAGSITQADALAMLGPRASAWLNDKYVELHVSDASELFDWRRFDLPIKRLYATTRVAGQSSEFLRDLYIEHLRAFNGLYEADGSGKLGPQRFLRSFDATIDSIASNGWNASVAVPLSRDGVLMDGAHRVAAASVAKVRVQYIRTDAINPSYTAGFFSTRGMNADLHDAAVCAYVESSIDARIALVWPSAMGRTSDLRNVLDRFSEVAISRDFFLSLNGAAHLVAAAYARESWVGGSSDGFSGARRKATWCFESDGPLRVFILARTGDLVRCKDEIRSLFRIGKHSIHIADTHLETLKLTRMLFNANTRSFMERAPLTASSWFERLYGTYSGELDKLSVEESERFCLDGSAVLATYGLRKPRDLDYLYAGRETPLPTTPEISMHNDHIRDYYSVGIDEIVRDPRHHYRFRDRKVVTPCLLKEMKLRRGELKDRDDVALIDEILSPASFRRPPTIYRLRDAMHPARIRSRLKMVAVRGRYLLNTLRRTRATDGQSVSLMRRAR